VRRRESQKDSAPNRQIGAKAAEEWGRHVAVGVRLHQNVVRRQPTHPAMSDTVETLILDLVEWVERSERTYHDTIDAWRTSCPRFPVWEDASERGLVERALVDGHLMVRATSAGLVLLKERRPEAYAELQRREHR